LPLLAATVGCKEFKYVDMQINFDQVTFASGKAFRVGLCHITVSGADSGDFFMKDNPTNKTDTCANHTGVGNPLMGGKFEWSTFADSGTLNFKLEAYEGMAVRPECLLGEGTSSVKLNSMMTLTGDITVTNSTPGCQPTGM
jgi:hypothetical protein